MAKEQFESLLALARYHWKSRNGPLIVLVGDPRPRAEFGPNCFFWGPFITDELAFEIEDEPRAVQGSLEIHLTESELTGWFIVPAGFTKESLVDMVGDWNLLR